HTRSKRDWSSDVCSSDLALCQLAEGGFERLRVVRPVIRRQPHAEDQYSCAGLLTLLDHGAEVFLHLRHRQAAQAVVRAEPEDHRSEERRVGKVWRSQWLT